VLLTELIVAIKAALIGIKDYAAGAGYVAVIINGFTIVNVFAVIASHLSHDMAEGITYTARPGIGVSLEDRQVASSLRSTMHLQSDFYLVSHLERREVVCQLLGVGVLLEERCGSNLLLTGSVAPGRSAVASVGTRNILAANLMSVDKSVDYITGTKLDRSIAVSEAVVQRRNRKEESVRLFSAKTDCGHVSFVRIHVASDVIAGIVLLTTRLFFSANSTDNCPSVGKYTPN
jgi:hypothetical protein